jgi:hypothetical protein
LLLLLAIAALGCAGDAALNKQLSQPPSDEQQEQEAAASQLSPAPSAAALAAAAAAAAAAAGGAVQAAIAAGLPQELLDKVSALQNEVAEVGQSTRLVFCMCRC